MCFPQRYTEQGFANLAPHIWGGGSWEALDIINVFSSLLFPLGGKHWHPNTHDKHRCKQTPEHTIHAVLRKRSDPDVVQRGDSGKRKLTGFQVSKSALILFSSERDRTGLNFPIATIWERVAVPAHSSGSPRPLS